MSQFPVNILMQRTVAYYDHIPLIWELLANEPFKEARSFEEYFKVWSDMVRHKVPFTKREYARRTIDLTLINSYRKWKKTFTMTTSKDKRDTDTVSQRMLNELEEAYHLDRTFYGYNTKDTDYSRFEWDNGFRDKIDYLIREMSASSDNNINESDFEAVQAHIKNPKCLMRVIARFMRLVKGRAAIQDVWDSNKMPEMVKYRPPLTDSLSVNLLIAWGEQASVFQSIPNFTQHMRKFFTNPARQVGPFVYGWFTQDSLQKAMIINASVRQKGITLYDALRFRKGYRWSTTEMTRWFDDMLNGLKQLTFASGDKKQIQPILDQIMGEGLSIQSNQGPSAGGGGGGGRSGS